MSISQNTLDVLQDAPQPNMQPDEFNLKAFAFAAVLYTLGLEINETIATLNQVSTTSESGDTLTIGLGAKNLTVEAGKSFAVGMSVRIADTVTGTRWMNGDVTAYDPLTGNLSVNVSAIQGSGNANVWTISQSFGGLTAGSVDTDKLAGLAVTTAKIADGAVGLEKLAAAVIEKLGASVGDIKAITGDYDPVLHADWLVVPTAPTNISRTAYPELFDYWGTKYGVGDGATTFGMYHIPANYALVQASGGNDGTNTVGEVISHPHSINAGAGTNWSGNTDRVNLGIGQTPTTTTTLSTGGPANLAAGSRVIYLVKYR